MAAILALAAAYGGGTAWSRPAAAQSHEIGSGPLGPALNRFGQLSGAPVTYDPALVRGKTTAGLKDPAQPEKSRALAELLAGTGLAARPDGAGGFVIVAAPPLPAAPAAEAPSTQAPSTQARPVREEVVVTGIRATTATKTDTPLMQTPQSISVITSAQFEDRGALNLQEALRYSSSIRPEPNGIDNRFDYSTARGGFSLAEYLDGIQRPSGFYAPRADLFTMERVEVLRGPSSVLYGQGSPGGVINAISKLPRFDTGGEVAFQYGSFDRIQGQADLNGVLDDGGTLAARMVAVVRDAGNQVDHGRDDRLLLMPSLRWQPSENTDLTLVGLHQHDRARSISQFLPAQATLLAPKGERMRDSTFLGEPDNNRFDKKADSISLLVTHRFAPWLELRSNTRYLQARQRDEQIYPNVYSGLENPFLDEDRRILSRSLFNTHYRLRKLGTDNNVLVSFETGPLSHRVLAGIDYQRDRVTGGFAAADVAPIDIYDPVYTGVPALVYDPIGAQVTSQTGFYVQDQIRYADVATLMLGVRRDHARTETEGSPAQADKVTSFRAGLIVEVIEGLSPYVNYAESFQPIVGVNVSGEPFLPERGQQYEVGVKWEPRPGALVTFSAFDIRGANRLVNDPNDPNNLLQIGEVRSRGLELEASLKLAHELEITASYSYVDAKVSRSTEPLEIGLPIIGVPEHLASLWAVKSFRITDDAVLRIGAGVRYMGPTMQAIAAPPDILYQRTPSYTLADALVALDWRQWTLSVNATNLFDKRYYALCGYYADCAVGQRRNVIATLGYRF